MTEKIIFENWYQNSYISPQKRSQNICHKPPQNGHSSAHVHPIHLKSVLNRRTDQNINLHDHYMWINIARGAYNNK